MEPRVSAKDVARHAGVSVATVSNVINNIHNKVSEETRQRVLKAIEELQYQPDFTARSLAKRKSNLLGIMLPITQAGDDKSLLLKDNPFYAELLSGIEYEAGQRGYDVVITGIRPEQSLKDWVRKRNMDGVIFLGITPEPFLNELKTLHVPVVLLDSYPKQDDCHSIGHDDFLAGKMACQYLIAQGHRTIGFLSGPLESSPVNQKRYEGYQAALKEAGIQSDSSLVLEDSVSFEGGCRMGLTIAQELGMSDNRVTALFCVADIVAFGAIKALRERGIKVPKELSVLGFDNLRTCEYLYPGLTTMDQGIFNKGVAAVGILVDDIEGRLEACQHIQLPVKLIERDSVCPPIIKSYT